MLLVWYPCYSGVEGCCVGVSKLKTQDITKCRHRVVQNVSAQLISAIGDRRAFVKRLAIAHGGDVCTTSSVGHGGLLGKRKGGAGVPFQSIGNWNEGDIHRPRRLLQNRLLELGPDWATNEI